MRTLPAPPADPREPSPTTAEAAGGAEQSTVRADGPTAPATAAGVSEQTLREGVHEGVSFADYLGDPCPEPSLTASTLRTLVLRSPAHAYLAHPRLGGTVEDAGHAADVGSAIHQAVLGGEDRISWVDADDWRTKDARAQRDAAREEGRIPMLIRERPGVDASAASVRAAIEGAGHHIDETERTLVWREGETWCRARPDVISGEAIIDIKTCANAQPSAWIRTNLVAGRYDLQAAWYLRGLATLRPAERPRTFIFAVVETAPPHATALIALDPRWLDLARQGIEYGLGLWRAALASGDWCGYDTRIHHAEPPPYLLIDAAAAGYYDERGEGPEGDAT